MKLMISSEKQWIDDHPYLEKVANFQRIVREVFDGPPVEPVSMPHWENYSADYSEGLPLLHSQRAGLEYREAASGLLVSAVDRLGDSPLPTQVAKHLGNLQKFLSSCDDNPRQAMEWLVTGTPENLSLHEVGLLRFLGWESLARCLRLTLAEFANWRDEKSWMRGYCPACGAKPVLSQLTEDTNTRKRILVCGCCHASWQFRRIGCPFCANAESDRLGILAIEEEPSFRIDFCRDCSGYLKTYTQSGEEELLLADWSTLHLDVLAGQQGLQRRGISLYDLNIDNLRG